MTMKVHPALEFLMTLMDEAEIVSNDEIATRPVLKMHGSCDECQRLVSVCPTKKDAALSKTEVMYVMMPMEWGEPVDWEAWPKKEHV